MSGKKHKQLRKALREIYDKHSLPERNFAFHLKQAKKNITHFVNDYNLKTGG